MAGGFYKLWLRGASAGLFIMRSIAGPPVFRNRQTSNPASKRKAILIQVV
jgi:hypothetical protein